MSCHALTIVKTYVSNTCTKNEMKRIKTNGPQISKVHSFSTNALKDQIWK